MKTTSVWWLSQMAATFKRLGLPIFDLFTHSGIPFDTLMESDRRIPQDRVTDLWTLAERASGQDHIGLLVGMNMSIASFPVLGYAILGARDLRDGLERTFRYQKMIGESADIRFSTAQQVACLEFYFSGDGQGICSHTLDAAVAASVGMIRLFRGDKWCPSGVSLLRSAPVNIEAYRDYFGCEPVFRASKNTLTFSTSELHGSSATLNHEYELAPAFSIERKSESMSDVVKRELVNLLHEPELSRGLLAKRLRLSTRTLQRQLQAEGQSYQSLLNEVRKAKALEYLDNAKLSQTEVAFLCGFADLSTFHHAFRRWFGKTPGAYRNSHLL